jgi:tRNA 5-methylaminomethyl-2-thiouridine biosynthesis bifunctional protein
MPSPQHHEIVVIGAGIAGATIANELLTLGKSVCVVDGAAGPASACSSHPYAIAHPHIGRGSPRLLRLTKIAFLLAEQRWGAAWNRHGVFQPSKREKTFRREELEQHLHSLGMDGQMALALDAKDAEQICGVTQSGVWLPRGASLDLRETAHTLLLSHERLNCLWSTKVDVLQLIGGKWALLNEHQQVIVSADKVIVAAAMGAKTLMTSIDIRLPLKPVRGQLSVFSVSEKSEWADQLPRVALSGDGYCLPAQQLQGGDYRWVVGSSFDEGEDDLHARQSSDDFNCEQAKGLLDYPRGNSAELKRADSFVGVRCVAGDRLPIIGRLTQRPGIFLATALGSRGILWSALAAKLISAQVLDDDLALEARFGLAADLVAALAPARFFAGALAAPSALGALASNSKPIFPSDPKAK